MLPTQGQDAPLDVDAKIISGLRQLGFRAGPVQAVISELRQRGELVGAPPQQWIREALRLLQPSRAPGQR